LRRLCVRTLRLDSNCIGNRGAQVLLGVLLEDHVAPLSTREVRRLLRTIGAYAAAHLRRHLVDDTGPLGHSTLRVVTFFNNPIHWTLCDRIRDTLEASRAWRP
jgi:hypothetical protein